MIYSRSPIDMCADSFLIDSLIIFAWRAGVCPAATYFFLLILLILLLAKQKNSELRPGNPRQFKQGESALQGAQWQQEARK